MDVSEKRHVNVNFTYQQYLLVITFIFPMAWTESTFYSFLILLLKQSLLDYITQTSLFLIWQGHPYWFSEIDIFREPM